MSEIDRLVDELQRDHDGDPWHGSSITRILHGLTSPQAALRPVSHVHSVWEIVLHMAAWKHEVKRRISGAPAGLPEEGDWPPVGDPTPERWAEALRRLDAAQASVIAAVRGLSEAELLAPTKDPRERETGAGVSYYVLVHGLAQHDAYHGGQLALLIKTLQGR